MADQEITLQIDSDAQGATSNLDKVDAALERIEKSIESISDSLKSLSGLDKISGSMDRLSNSIDKVDPSKFDKVATSINKIASYARSTENTITKAFGNIQNSADSTDKAISGMARDLASSFNITSPKKVDEITVAMRKLYDAMDRMKFVNSLGVSKESTSALLDEIIEASDALTNLIRNNGIYKNEIDQTTQSIVNWIKQTKNSTIALGDLNKEVGDFAKKRALLGSSFKKGFDGTGFDTYIEEMNKALGTNFDSTQLAETFNELANIMERAKESTLTYDMAIQKNKVSMSEITGAVSGYVTEMSKLIDTPPVDLAEQFKDVPPVIDEIVKKTEQIPEAINQVGDGATDKIGQAVDNIGKNAETATKAVENATTALATTAQTELAKVEQEYDNISRKVHQASESTKEFDNAINSGAKVTRLSDVLADIDRMVSELPKLSDTYTDGTAKLQTMINAYNELDKAIKGVWSGKTNILGEGKELDEATEKLRFLRDEIEKLKTGLLHPEKLTIDVNEPINDIEKLYARLNELKKLIDTMKHNKINFTDDDFKSAISEYTEIQNKIKAIQAPAKPEKGGIEWMAQIVAIQHELEKAANVMSRWGDIAKNAFLKALIPLKLFKHEFEELKTFIEHIGSGFAMIFKPITKVFGSIKKKWSETIAAMEKRLNKLLRTFVYMGFRKIFTQIYKTIGEAVDSLAKFSQSIGTDFNHSVSLAMADFRYLGASILAAFEPLINVIVPILDIFVDALVNVINQVNMFFTALTGAKSFTIARKKIIDYADALKDANKAAKQLTMGIDELNILNDTRSSSNKEDEDLFDWQEISADAIPKAIKDAADKLKDMANQLIQPILKAWDNVGDYVIDGFKHMMGSIRGLIADIARDFLEVWQQPETLKMLEDILSIFGDIFHIIGNIADGLRDAWNYNKTGLHILEDIRDIFATIIRHIHTITSAMVDWSAQLDFKPILTAIEVVLRQFNYAIDQMGYVFEDVVLTVILPLLQKVLEDYAPRLLGVIGNIIEGIGNIAKQVHEAWNALNFGDKVVAGLDGLVQAIMPHLEAVGEAFKEWADNLDFKPLMNAFTRLLTSLEPVADFLGGVFEDIVNHYILPMAKHITETVIPMILDAISHFANAVDWTTLRKNIDKIIEAFEHLQGAIGEGVADAMDRIGQAIAQFVNSQEFQEFLDNLADFMNRISPEMISNILTAIGIAILRIAEALVKFANSDTFQRFLNALINFLTYTDANKLAGYLLGIAKAIAFFKFASFVGKGFANFLSFVAIVGKITEAKALKDMAKTLGEVGANASKAGESLAGIGAAVGGVVKIIGGIAAVIGGAVLAIKEFVDMWQNGWSVIKTILEALGLAIAAVGAVILGAPAAIAAVIAAIVFVVSQLAIALHEHWDAISAWFSTTWEAFSEWCSTTWQNIVQGIVDAWNGFQEKVSAIWDAISQWFSDVWTAFKEWVATTWQSIVQGVVDAWNGIAETLAGIWEGIRTWFVEAWENFHSWAKSTWDNITQSIADTWNDLKEKASAKWNEIRDTIGEKWEEIKTNTLAKWDEIKSNLDQKWSTFKKDAETLWNNLKESISKTWDSIQDKWTSTWQSIKQAVAEKWNSIVSDAHSIFEGIGAFFKSLWDGIESTWDSVWSAIKDTVSAWWENIRTDAQDGWDEAVSFVENLWNDVKGLWNSVWGSIQTNLSNAWTNIKNTALNIWNGLSATLGGIWSKIKEGANGLWDGVSKNWKAAWQGIGDFVKSVVNNVLGGIEKLINGAISGVNWLIEKINAVSPDFIGDLPSVPEVRLPRFATGGFPEDGLFLANHNELVGKFSNGQTAVANNQQITEGIKEAVASAMIPVLNEIAQNTRETADKSMTLNVDSREIARASNNGQNKLGKTLISFT